MHNTVKYWVILVIIASVVLSAVYVFSLPERVPSKVNLMMSYWYNYIQQVYKPEPIRPSEISSYPPEHLIEGVPWISYNKPYCASTCLQMIAYYYGIRKPIGYFNLIMSFTCGATLIYTNNNTFFLPYSDPLSGLASAGQYLGLKYRMLVTDNKKLFLDALRYLISRDIPVIVPVNASRLYNKSGFLPHFVLVVGYSNDVLYIYEPVATGNRARFSKHGIPIDADTLARAVEDSVEGMSYPVDWKYVLIYYTPGGKIAKSLKDAIRNCAYLQIGVHYGPDRQGIYLGAKAIEKLADLVKRGQIDRETVIIGLSMAVITRYDNAMFLRSQFPDNPYLIKAAKLLYNLSKLYEKALNLLEKSYSEETREIVAKILQEAAKYEKEVGYLMLHTVKEPS